MKVVNKIVTIVSLVLLGTALVACGTTPDEALPARASFTLKPAPLVEGGAAVFFDQVSDNPGLIDPLLAQLEASPKQALLKIIDYGEDDKQDLQKMSLAQVRVYVTPIINVLDTTQKMAGKSLQIQGLQYYYMEHGKVKTIDYNILWDLYLLGITPVRDTAPSEMARLLDDLMGTDMFPYVPL